MADQYRAVAVAMRGTPMEAVRRLLPQPGGFEGNAEYSCG
jgi:hypothetical protein